MTLPVSKHRLRSSAFIRKDESEKVDPKRMIFLSVEGDHTERTYFEHLNDHLDNSIIRIEVLRHRRGDGYSDPKYVIELLAEYINVRDGELIPSDLPPEFTAKYSKDILQKYLDNSTDLNRGQRKAIENDLLLIGIDLDYRRYLQSYNNDTDVFAVVLDRDCGNHSRELMVECVQKCSHAGYGCYVSNPCFEFWLLLHLSNVKEEFNEEQQKELLENQKVSGSHTKTSCEVSARARHGKIVSKHAFDTYYFPNIQKAMLRARDFASAFPELYDHLGSNLPELLYTLGFDAE